MQKKEWLIAPLLLWGTAWVWAEEPPISLLLGQITSQDVHIRTGPTTNCEDVARATQGDLFLVRDERFGWLQIDLPLWAIAWIHEDLIRLEREEAPPEKEKEKDDPEKEPLEPSLEEFLCFGVVTADRVNLRSRPGLRYTTLGQCHSDTRVRCTGRYGEWIRIQAPPGQTGWVHRDLVALRPLQLSSLELEKSLSEREALLAYGRLQEGGVLLHPVIGPFVKLKNEDLVQDFLGQKVLVAGKYELADSSETPPLLHVLSIQQVAAPEDKTP